MREIWSQEFRGWPGTRYTAILDACVLFPAPVADALMSRHAAGLFAAQWGERIDDEWIRGVLRERPELDGQLQRRRDAMRRAVPDWEVSPLAYEPLMAGLGLPDMDDVHVLAAAIAVTPTASPQRTVRAVQKNRMAPAATPSSFAVSPATLFEAV